MENLVQNNEENLNALEIEVERGCLIPKQLLIKIQQCDTEQPADEVKGLGNKIIYHLKKGVINMYEEVTKHTKTYRELESDYERLDEEMMKMMLENEKLKKSMEYYNEKMKSSPDPEIIADGYCGIITAENIEEEADKLRRYNTSRDTDVLINSLAKYRLLVAQMNKELTSLKIKYDVVVKNMSPQEMREEELGFKIAKSLMYDGVTMTKAAGRCDVTYNVAKRVYEKFKKKHRNDDMFSDYFDYEDEQQKIKKAERERRKREKEEAGLY